jgi:hypothetical protein
MPIFEEIRDDVANTNFKVIGGAPAAGSSIAQHLAQIDAVDRQRMTGVVSNVALMEATLQRAGIDLSESVAGKKIAESDLARSMTEMSSVVSNLQAQMAMIVAAIQQMTKVAQTTPPVTP